MPLIPPLLPKLPGPAQAVVTRTEARLDRIIELLEMLVVAELRAQGVETDEIPDLLLRKK